MKSSLLALLLVGCAASTVNERARVEETLVTFAMRTDAKDWSGVRSLFTPSVQFSMAAEPKDTPSAEMTAIWEKALKDIPVVHHQLGNFLIAITGDQADAQYYGISLQQKAGAKGGDSRGFVGHYHTHLVRLNGEWKIDRLDYRNKMVLGNQKLDQ
jgi:hypothetical protein